ncbi:MAG: hypothetical protein EXS55_00035 [Candidatus Magasanikbacteria bacterium]|nr:hypothetical protein [Candidatus Magasanikbacteria bacterium]
MATIVTGDQYYKLDGKLLEIVRQLRQREGYPFDTDQLDVALQALTEGRFEAVGGDLQFPSSAEAAKHGFTVETDVIPTLFKANGIEYPSFFEEGDGGSVVGEVMCGRAMILEANKGLLDAVYLRDNPHLIPEEFRGKKAIVFTATRLRRSDCNLYVAGLFWRGDAWVLDFGWVGNDFGARYVLPRGK